MYTGNLMLHALDEDEWYKVIWEANFGPTVRAMELPDTKKSLRGSDWRDLYFLPKSEPEKRLSYLLREYMESKQLFVSLGWRSYRKFWTIFPPKQL